MIPSTLAKPSLRVPSTPELCKPGAGAADVSPIGDKLSGHVRWVMLPLSMGEREQENINLPCKITL